MIEAIIGKIIGSIGGLIGIVFSVAIQAILWFLGTFVFGSLIWLIYTLTNRRRKS